jgi:NNP family nitrate/nitrite transporter-like MFS transporter
MDFRAFRQSGHWPTLFCAFLYFDISFMVWVLLGALVNSIAVDIRLSDAEKGLLVAVPLLGGAVLRLGVGWLTDYVGARRTGLVGLLLTLVPLALGWLWGDTFGKLILVGLLLGVAGASFAAALPLASRWYPPRYQGMVMGIAGAGNSGTALAAFFGPRLAEWIGWQGVFAVALVPVLLTLLLFALFAKDSPNQPAPRPLREYATVLGERDTWWFCLFYAVTFGGFVGLASFLNLYFHTQHGLSRIEAGSFATLCVLAGSFLRPVGGWLSDRFGGLRVLTFLYVAVGLLFLDLATSPPLFWSTFLLFTVMAFLGLGNGAVFQLVPQRFSREIGVVTGIIGAAGGIGGFFLPALLGTMRQQTGSFSGGFLILALVSISAMVALVNASRAWEGVFVEKGGLASQALAGGGR